MKTDRQPTRRSFLTAAGAATVGARAPLPALAAWSAQATPASPALDDTARLLKALSEAPGPSGFEEEVRKIVVGEFSALGAKVEYDGLGSVLATLPGGAASGPRVMVTAHLDEVGLMVQHITPEGFLRVKTLGGILEQALPDQRWTILGRNGPVPAISGLRTTHVLPASQRGVVWPLEETFLDVGAGSREEVEKMGIRPGDGIAPMSSFLALPNGRYAGKAWDDRVGLGVMIAASRRIRAENIALRTPIVWVATTQEEIGLRGAQTAVQKARPDLGISIEAGVSADYPAITPTQAQERLGAGPGLFLLDSTMIPNRKLRDFFFDVAQQSKIPLQPNVLTGYGEDGAEIQRYDSGRPVVNMTVPTRYLHSHTGIIQRADFDRAVDLLVQVLTRLDAAKVTELASFGP
ncbi:MAG TPA: M42 family metallopeptidase [Vicinamibacterales bacterium]|nr:M42 family metallopeptidase [Vicinamibacterales bacterium]